MHVAALRKELDDPLFTRTGAGLAFTPGGLRLASRAVEILGLQQQTAIEVTEAAHGRRLLRIAASSAFAEHAAPGLIELFSSRADDLSVELSVHPTSRFRELICSRAVDIAIGPASESSIGSDGSIFLRPFLKYQIITVVAPNSPLAAGIPMPALLRHQQWMLGPSAGSVDGEIATMLRGWRFRSPSNGSSRAMPPRWRRSCASGAPRWPLALRSPRILPPDGWCT